MQIQEVEAARGSLQLQLEVMLGRRQHQGGAVRGVTSRSRN